MSTLETILWAGLTLAGTLGSAMCSGLETGSYRLNRVRLHVLAHQGQRPARRLLARVRQPTMLLSLLLISNNIANYCGSIGMTVLLEARGFNDWQVVILNVAVVTPLLLIVGEILPKDIFSAYADWLMYRLAWILQAMYWILMCTGALPLVYVVSQLAAKLTRRDVTRGFHPRREMQDLVKEGVGRGLLSDEQTAMVDRVLELSDLRVQDEMIPWHDVITIPLDAGPAALWELADRTSRSRFPVVSDTGAVVGIVHVLDVLLHQRETCPPVESLMTPAVQVPDQAPLRVALATLQKARTALAIVGSEQEPRGVITIKDLVEPLTGELSSW